MKALELARGLDVAVDALRVLPDRLWWLRWLPKAVLRPHLQRQLERARAVVRTTRLGLAPMYGDEPRPGQVVVRTGNFVSEVATHAAKRAPEIIAVPPDQARLGWLATKLALTSACRVFVPRPSSRNRTMLAASDLATRGLPVLRDARLLAEPLRMELVSFHNVNPLFDPDGQAVEQPRLRERMTLAHESLSALGRAAVRSGVDAAAAILAEAREAHVDLVVVGVKARSPLERLIYGSVASQVVERAHCSVLVTPILAGAPR